VANGFDMTNTLYLPELREMLAENNAAELAHFCTALHPARTAEFMEGLAPSEAWEVLRHAEMGLRVEIFGFFDDEKQVEIAEAVDRREMAALVAEMPPDERVDMLELVDSKVVDELLELVPIDERRDIQRLSAYEEGTAGSVMTTEFARLSENLLVDEAISEIRRQAKDLETVYYLYIVDDEDHLRGLVSFRQLVSAMDSKQTIGDLMERDLFTVNVQDDQEKVADDVAHYDLLAIPVVDEDHRMVGIITHDDVIDVVREEAAEDAYRSVGVAPLDVGYLETALPSLIWKRGVWLTVLFFGALLTAFALQGYEEVMATSPWLVIFIPLVISTGGNTGNQSATLIITALTQGNVTLSDWWQVIRRELLMGVVFGGLLGLVGFICACFMTPSIYSALEIPITLLLVVICGTFFGSSLPLLFKRLGLDPAVMSNSFVAGLIDVTGILIYMHVHMGLVRLGL
jgi:magnesium transporter